MLVFRGIPELATQAVVLTIGNFDGVHLGHQAILKSLTAKARSMSIDAAVLIFEPHPREYFTPDNAPARLTSLREKLALLEACQINRVYICHFNAHFASIPAEVFINTFLVHGLQIRHLIIGDDFHFGAHRQGDFSLLKAAGEQNNFGVEAMPTFTLHGHRISSSAIRNELAAGNLVQATRLLGRPYSIAGRVIQGRQLGRTLGYPTANIQMKHRKPAFSGVFAVRVEGLTGQPLNGVANIGVRPTVTNNGRPLLEVNLFDWNQDCYGARLRVHFLHKLRNEMKFDSLDALTTQIATDAQLARDWLTQHTLNTPQN